MPYIMSYSHRPGIPGVEEDDYWQDQWGSRLINRAKPWKLGLPMPAKYFPTSGYLTGKVKTIPNIFCQGLWFCDEEIRKVIEGLEPGRHRFYPFTLRNSKKGDIRAELFIIHALEPIEAIDIDRSPGVREFVGTLEVPEGIRTNKPGKRHANYVVLKRDYPKDRHIWRDTRVETSNGIFISDHLHSVITQTKNVCVSYMPLWEAEKADKIKETREEILKRAQELREEVLNRWR